MVNLDDSKEHHCEFCWQVDVLLPGTNRVWDSDTNLIGVKIPTQKVVQVRLWRSLILSTGFLTYDYGVQLRGMVSLLEHGYREEGNEGKDIN